MQNETALRQLLTKVLASQKLAVLATYGNERPYCTLMAFAATPDLRHLVVSTKRQTQKYANLISHARVSLLIDNRKNQDEDFQQAVAITAIGTAAEMQGTDRERFLAPYLFKHPYLKGFLTAPDCTIIAIRVEVYKIVSHFQQIIFQEDYVPEITELKMD